MVVVVAEGHTKNLVFSRLLRCFACMWLLGLKSRWFSERVTVPSRFHEMKSENTVCFLAHFLWDRQQAKRRKSEKSRGEGGVLSRKLYRQLAVSTCAPLRLAPGMRLEAQT